MRIAHAAKANLFRRLAHGRGLRLPLLSWTHAFFRGLSLSRRQYELVVLLAGRRREGDRAGPQPR